jgi:transposase
MDLKLNQLRKEAKAWRKICPRVTFRVLALIELTKRRQQFGLKKLRELDYELIGAKLGVSGRSIIRWKKTYEKDGVNALLPSPIQGRPAKPTRGHVARQILEWRKLYNWGAEVIQAHLLHDQEV